MTNEYFDTGLLMAPTEPDKNEVSIAKYTGQCQCNDPGDCANCPDKEYDQGGEA